MIQRGSIVEVNGEKFTVLLVLRREDNARDVAKTLPGLNYRIVDGKWCVLKKLVETPDYVLK